MLVCRRGRSLLLKFCVDLVVSAFCALEYSDFYNA